MPEQDLPELPGLAYAWGRPNITGLIRETPADFRVREQLRFEPTGAGEHWLIRIEKTNCNTLWVQSRLAEFAGVRPMDVGFAGMKDRRAVCEQWFSVLNPPGAAIAWQSLSLPGVRVLESARHQRKLRRGKLEGNHFAIRIRGLEGDLDSLSEKLEIIAAEGVPNYFGRQRFGRNAANVELAHRILSGERKRVSRQKRQFALSAARSLIFNAVLARRVENDTWNRILDGDVAGLSGSRSIFCVEELTREIRLWEQRKDIHPTGPLWGTGELLGRGHPRELEEQVSKKYVALTNGLARERVKHGRRALRMMVDDLRWKLEGNDLKLECFLGPGGYATTLLRELVNTSEPAEKLKEIEDDVREN